MGLGFAILLFCYAGRGLGKPPLHWPPLACLGLGLRPRWYQSVQRSCSTKRMSLFVCLTLQKEENKIHHELRHHPPYLALVQPVHLSISMLVRNCIFKKYFQNINIGGSVHHLCKIHQRPPKNICHCTDYYPRKSC